VEREVGAGEEGRRRPPGQALRKQLEIGHVRDCDQPAAQRRLARDREVAPLQFLPTERRAPAAAAAKAYRLAEIRENRGSHGSPRGTAARRAEHDLDRVHPVHCFGQAAHRRTRQRR
jgi:hypothetical protein